MALRKVSRSALSGVRLAKYCAVRASGLPAAATGEAVPEAVAQPARADSSVSSASGRAGVAHDAMGRLLLECRVFRHYDAELSNIAGSQPTRDAAWARKSFK